jgi:hypothetical protein
MFFMHKTLWRCRARRQQATTQLQMGDSTLVRMVRERFASAQRTVAAGRWNIETGTPPLNREVRDF